MDATKFSRIAANVAASYISRAAIDRAFIERFLDTPFGAKLIGASPAQQHIGEFIAYCASALAQENMPNSGAIETFLNRIIAESPPKIVEAIKARGADWQGLQATVREVASAKARFYQAGDDRLPGDQDSPNAPFAERQPSGPKSLFSLLMNIESVSSEKLVRFIDWHTRSSDQSNWSSEIERGIAKVRFRNFLLQQGVAGLNNMAQMIPDEISEPSDQVYSRLLGYLRASGAPLVQPGLISTAATAVGSLLVNAGVVAANAKAATNRLIDDQYDAAKQAQANRSWIERMMHKILPF